MDDFMQLMWIYINIHLFVAKDESWGDQKCHFLGK